MPQGDQIQHSLLLQGSNELVAIIAFVIAVIFAIIAYRSTYPPITRGRKLIFMTLRILAFLFILFALLEPLFVTRGIMQIEPEVAIIADNSRSIGKSDSALAADNFLMSNVILSDKFKTTQYLFGDSLRIAGKPSFDDEMTALGDGLITLRNIQDTLKENGIRPNIGAAVLISDGQNNLGDDPVSVADQMPFPIYTIGVGSQVQPKNIALRRIVANKIGYKDVTTTVLAYIEGWGIDDDVPVIFKKGNETIARKTIKPGQKGEQVEVEFELTPKEVGQNYYRIVTPISEDEMIKNDNSRSFSMNILPSRKKILLAFNNLNWDYTFLKRALETNQHYEIHGADFSGKLKGDFTPPINDEQFAEFDAIVLINFATDRTNSASFKRYIEQGGSVLHITGPKTRYYSDLLSVSPIEKAPRGWTADRFNPIITIEGLSHSILDLSGENDDDEMAELDEDENWPAEMPPLRGFLMIDQPKKQGKILMEHADLSGIPVISVFETGKSRQALINGGDIWRWSFTPFGFGSDNRIYNKIMQNTAQWLMARDEVSPFVLTTDNRVYRSGEPVYFNATLRDDAGNPLEGKTIELTILRSYEAEDGSQRGDTITAIMEESGSGFYNLRMPSMGIGDFKIRGEVLEDENAPVSEKWTSFRVEEYSTEMADLRIDEQLLRQIALRSEGKYLEQSEYEDFLSELELKTKNETIRDEYSIWEKWWLLIVILVLLGMEWFLRKRSNLP